MFIADGKFTHGKYAGQEVVSVAQSDPGYLRWVLDSQGHLALALDEVEVVERARDQSTATALVVAPGRAIVHSRGGAITLTAEQETAVSAVADWVRSGSKFFALTGAAGTGKTTVLNSLIEYLGARVAWSAMTGKAAARMKEASNVPAKTLHSALYHPPKEVDNEKERKVDLVFDEVRRGTQLVLVVDEASMITEQIRDDIERSDYERVLLVGDPYQLPPVEGKDFSVFTGMSSAHLTEVKRTAGAVLAAATSLRETDEICVTSSADASQYDFEFWDRADDAFLRVLDLWWQDRDDHVVLTWKNVNRMHVNQAIRERFGITNVLPQPGEPIVLCDNNHRLGLMNGDMVRVVRWLDDGPTFSGRDHEGIPFEIKSRYLTIRSMASPSEPEKQIVALLTGGEVQFDGKMKYVGLHNWKEAVARAERKEYEQTGKSFDGVSSITYGYCLTAHKAQGSQYRRVTTYVPGDLRNKHFQKQTRLPDGRQMSYSTRWLYTAISRAVERSSLIVSR